MRRCPVEEIGRNSVIPSMIPSKTTAIQIGIRGKNDKSLPLTSDNLPVLLGRGYPYRLPLRGWKCLGGEEPANDLKIQQLQAYAAFLRANMEATKPVCASSWRWRTLSWPRMACQPI